MNQSRHHTRFRSSGAALTVSGFATPPFRPLLGDSLTAAVRASIILGGTLATDAGPVTLNARLVGLGVVATNPLLRLVVG